MRARKYVYACPYALVKTSLISLFCSEETAKLEDLQDKNITQKEVLRDLMAKIEVCECTPALQGCAARKVVGKEPSK